LIAGRVNEVGVVLVDLLVESPTGDSDTVSCMVDTGFDGLLTLPAAIIESLGLEERGQTGVILADGTQTKMTYYPAIVQWHGRKETLEILEADNLPLIGMSLCFTAPD